MLPYWIKEKVISRRNKKEDLLKLKHLFNEFNLHTICEEAKCPNIYECFSEHTATFLILGNICTRDCKFCSVKKGKPLGIDESEAKNIANLSHMLGLKYVCITSVTRDDLYDGGASQFIKVIKELNKFGIKVEVLLPLMDYDSLKKVIDASPSVIGYNIETVPSLYSVIRPKFNYNSCLEFLAKMKEINNSIITKSGIMLGLGETELEVINVMKDLRSACVDIITIGQYIRPTFREIEVKRYVTPEEFNEYERIGYSLGFKYVLSGPFVRSSYKGYEVWAKLKEE